MTAYDVRSPARLGEVIAHIRKQQGLSQTDIADELGFARKYLYSIESGRPSIYAQRLFEVLDVLGVRLVIEAEEARRAERDD